MSKYWMGGILGALLLSGCATAHLSKGPDVYLLEDHPGALRLGVAKVVDERGTTHAGTVGGTGINVKEDVTELTTNYLIHYLNDTMKANIVTISNTSPEQIPSLAARKKVDRVVLAKIRKLKIFSLDIILQPVEVDVDLEVAVYDETGKEIYREEVPGHYQKRINSFSIIQMETGELVEATIKEAMNNLVKTPDFKDVLARNPIKVN